MGGTQAELESLKPPHDVVITTERLRLRPVQPLTDIHIVHRLRQNVNSMKYSTTGVETEEDPLNSVTFDKIKAMVSIGSFAFIIELRPSSDGAVPETIGFIGMSRPGSCGYLLDEPYWGKGYATEALNAFLQKYWEHFPEGPESIPPEDRKHLLAHVFEGNVASENVLKKSGFRVLRARVPGVQAGQPVIETVFIVERPEPVAIHAFATGLAT